MNLTINLSDRDEVMLAYGILGDILGAEFIQGETLELTAQGHPHLTGDASLSLGNQANIAGLSNEPQPVVDEDAVALALAANLFGGNEQLPLASAEPAAVVVPLPTVHAAATDTSVASVPQPADPVLSTAAVTPTPAPSGKRDVRGLPWNEQIHAGTRALNSDGTWRYKRNVSKDLIAKIEAELAGGVAPAPVAAPAKQAPPANAPAATVPGALTFGEVCSRVQAAITAKTLTQAQLGETVVALGFKSFPEVAKRPDYFATLLSNLGL
jgi:hypothetical protein